MSQFLLTSRSFTSSINTLPLHLYSYIAASFISTDHVSRWLSRSRKLPLELSEAQADKEDVHVAIVLADSEEPTSAKSIQCQYTAKQNQHVACSVC